MIILFFLTIITLTSAKGHFETEIYESKILKQTIKYNIYYPDRYSKSKKYPVIYGLHGMGWNHTYYDLYEPYFNKAIKERQIQPFLMFVPDAHNSFFINTNDGKFNYEDFFFNEFIPFIESKYPIETTKLKPSIFGISMGGYGSVYYSLIKKDYFSSVVALSPALLIDDYDYLKSICTKESNSKLCFQSKFVFEVFGDENRYLDHNINSIIKSYPKGTFTTPTYACIGKQDYLHDLVIDAKYIMQNFGMNLIYDYDEIGEHEEWYWIEKLPIALKFIETNWKITNDQYDIHDEL